MQRTKHNGRTMRVGFALTMLTILLTSAFPSTAQEDAQEWPETVMVLGDPSMMDHEGSYEEVECEEQFALYVTDHPGCGAMGGEHVRNGWYIMFGWRTVNAGNYGPVPLTGDLHSRIYWTDSAGQEHEVPHTCSWHKGTFLGCRISTLPSLPPLGATFHFECHSLPGAIGGWAECFLAHG